MWRDASADFRFPVQIQILNIDLNKQPDNTKRSVPLDRLRPSSLCVIPVDDGCGRVDDAFVRAFFKLRTKTDKTAFNGTGHHANNGHSSSCPDRPSGA